MIPDLVVHGAFMLFAITFMMLLATVFTWVERKQSAIMSDRIGANRCYIRIPFTNIKFVAWGLFHGVADGGKLLLKENFTPLTYDRLCYNLAPWLAAVPVLLVFAVVPFGGTLVPGRLVDADTFPSLAAGLQGFFGERSYTMQVAGLDAGILFVLAISGIGVLGTMLAGWSSNNKFSLMGASRAASQMISYEVAMGFALVGMVVTYGTLDLDAMVKWQSGLCAARCRLGHLRAAARVLPVPHRGIAENKRIPFDLPEAESELVAGYFTEYTGMKFGMFMLSEYIEIVVISALLVTLFLGGFNLPFLTARASPSGRTGRSRTAPRGPPVVTFSAKTFSWAGSRSSSAGRCRASATTS